MLLYLTAIQNENKEYNYIYSRLHKEQNIKELKSSKELNIYTLKLQDADERRKGRGRRERRKEGTEEANEETTMFMERKAVLRRQLQTI